MPLHDFSPNVIGAKLAVVQYGPVALGTYSVTNTGGLTALDTTNLTASFEVPSSGAVVVRFSASMNGSGSNIIGFGILNHSGGAQIGSTIDNVSGSGGVLRQTAEWLLTGLSPGLLGIDIAAGVNSGTFSVYAMGHTGAVNSSKVGPALIVVEAA